MIRGQALSYEELQQRHPWHGVERYLAVNPAATIKQMHLATGVAKSTLHRFMVSAIDLGIVVRESRTGLTRGSMSEFTYSLTPQFAASLEAQHVNKPRTTFVGGVNPWAAARRPN